MDELISKQAAIDALKRKQDDGKGDLSRFYNTIIQHDIEAIMALPPAEPEIIRCKDCKHRYVEGDNVRYNTCELNHNNVQSDDWYCADAERRKVTI